MATTAHTSTIHLTDGGGQTIGDADMFQGLWTVEQYLRLTERSNRLFEYNKGSIEVLPMPTDEHQDISGFLYTVLREYMAKINGKVLYSPIPLRISDEQYREPDLLLMLDANDPRRQNAVWLGADMVVEIVSPSNRQLDTKVKRAEYAHIGIAEYWIVDPQKSTIMVLRLEGEEYIEHGIFRRGETATSVLLEGFAVEVSAVLDAR